MLAEEAAAPASSVVAPTEEAGATTEEKEEGGKLCDIEQIVKTIESSIKTKDDFDRILKVVYKVGSDTFYKETL